jgi:hypothetical protein
MFVWLRGSYCISILAFRSRNNVEQTLVCDTPFSVKIKMYENQLALCYTDRSRLSIAKKRLGKSASQSAGLPHYRLKRQDALNFVYGELFVFPYP